jgi:Kef-type K+ transport system membrane component KefB
MRKSSFFYYALALLLSVALMLWLLNLGETLPAPGDLVVEPVPGTSEPGSDFWSSPMSILLLQVIVILLVARGLSSLTSRMGQPQVISELAAGIFLGPSLLGFFFPQVSLYLFPEGSLDNLHTLSQVGLILFMFIIGMELDIRVLRTQAKAAILVTKIGIFIPLLMGMALALFLYTDYAQNGATFAGFALFLGISLTITAFPVLSRIIQERGLYKSPLGSMAITSAAAVDISAWCLLAAVVAMIKAGSFVEAIVPVVTGIAYVVFMLTFVKPLMKKLGSVYASKEIFNKKVVGLIFIVLLGSAYLAEIIGIHALFGAFLAGVIMPHNLTFKKIITDKIEDVSLVLLLPLFFVFTGLRTEIGLLNTGEHWLVFLVVVVVAVVSKFGAVGLSGRLAGQSLKESLSLGVLMNTRGLMAIVVLNIGYELGILSAEIFTMLVLMALITTAMTGPMLSLFERIFVREDFGARVLSRIRTSFRVFLSFGPPKMGSTLIRLADQLTLKHNRTVDITALHITPSYDVKPYEAVLYEKEGFQPIRSTAQLLGLKITTLYKNTEEVDKEIISTVAEGRFDLVLVGAARPMFTDKATGGVLKHLLEESQTNIGVLIDRGFVMAESILLLLGSDEDMALLEYAYRFRSGNRARVTILKVGDGQHVDFYNKESPYFHLAAHFNEVIEQRIPDKQLLSHFNLILVGLDLWNEINKMRASWIKDCPSILVVKHHHDLARDVEPKLVREAEG